MSVYYYYNYILFNLVTVYFSCCKENAYKVEQNAVCQLEQVKHP